MTVGSAGFIVLALVLSALFPFVPGLRARQVLLASCNFAFLWNFIPNVASWAVLAAFLASGYAAGRLLTVKPRGTLLAIYLAGLVLAFILIKKYVFLAYVVPPSLMAHGIVLVGISYMLFRQIHFVVDSMQQQIDRATAWDYLNYQTNLFALLAGPIQRYQDFRESWNRLEPLPKTGTELLKAWFRVFLGVVKMAGFGAALFFVYDKCHTRLLGMADAPVAIGPAAALLLFAAIFITYPLYMYANFSGYCDIAIATSGLFGLALPENFDRPYLSRNMIDFWTRWHRTLGLWIRDYLFIPLYRMVAEWQPQSAARLAFMCYFVAFVFAGVWHGTTSNFLVFGILHGLGASAAKLWEARLVNRRGRAFLKPYLASPGIRVAAIAGTMAYFSLTMFFFADPLDRCGQILRVVAAALSGRGDA
jgi:alginate O-acetyltransferase complex protein AlgI